MDGDNELPTPDSEFKVQEQHSLNELANDMFKKSADYLQGELLLVMVRYLT